MVVTPSDISSRTFMTPPLHALPGRSHAPYASGAGRARRGFAGGDDLGVSLSRHAQRRAELVDDVLIRCERATPDALVTGRVGPVLCSARSARALHARAQTPLRSRGS